MIAMNGQVWRPAERGDADCLAVSSGLVEEFGALGLESDAEAAELRLDHPGLDLRQGLAGRLIARSPGACRPLKFERTALSGYVPPISKWPIVDDVLVAASAGVEGGLLHSPAVVQPP
ncbi:hypothetical protein GA0070606_0221 [Micromonospora citrea]|uniref:Uncharacterized protein n=1 Tax=Micromonospora citrea TaxID=47855 RepID=A0A1C6TR82_9ACTN|nr:hypothetical protein GA0070606_0221 [Micromonospora citrea]